MTGLADNIEYNINTGIGDQLFDFYRVGRQCVSAKPTKKISHELFLTFYQISCCTCELQGQITYLLHLSYQAIIFYKVWQQKIKTKHRPSPKITW